MNLAANRAQVHVLHVVRHLDGAGGMERVMQRVITNLAERGIRHSVAVLCSSEQHEGFPDGVEIHRVETFPNDPLLPVRLWRLARRIRPTVIHARNWGAWPDVALARLFAWSPVPLIFSFHGFDTTTAVRLRRRIACNLLSRITTRVFTVSRALRRALVQQMGMARAKIDVIYNGVDVACFRPRPDAIRPGPVVVATLGSLEPVKHQSLLVEAGAMLLRKGLDMDVRIAGAGSEEPRLREMIGSMGVANRVHLVGWISDPAAFLADTDVFVLPSKTEGHPNALLEAMACALPCVGTNVGGIPEVLDGGRHGMVVQSDEPEALAAAIRRLVRDPALRVALGTAAREHVCREYSQSRMLDAYERLYRWPKPRARSQPGAD